MSKLICIMGESGAGKTTSMRNLDPKSTYYIDSDKKGLSWKGWKTQFNTENKNYAVSDRPEAILQLLVGLSAKRSDIKTIVVDTINGIMVAEEMRRSKEKGYDKWQELATYVWTLVDNALGLRDDLTIIFTAHTQTDRDDSGYTFTHVKTSGKKLERIVLESKFPVVLLAKCVDGRYLFETHARNSTAKMPMGAIEGDTIDNDIIAVLKALEDY